jgi:hypothetical protein
LLDDQIKPREVVGACSTHLGEDVYACKILVGNPEGERYLEALGIAEKVVLK